MPFTIPNPIPYQGEILSTEHQQNYEAIEAEFNDNVIRKDGSVGMTAALTLASAPTQNLHAATKLYVDDIIPVGVALEYHGATAPSGWTFPIGQTLARSSAPFLAAAIAPDASSPYYIDATNFRLPDRRERVAVGKGTTAPFTVLGAIGGAKDSIVPYHDHGHTITATQGTHSHTARVARSIITSDTSNPSGTMASPTYPGAQGEPNVPVTVDAASAGPITISGGITAYGSSPTNANLQPYIVCNYIMRLR